MRWIIRLLFVLVAVAAVAIGALFLMPAEKIAGIVTQQFKAATGREMTLEGDVRPSLWPELGVKTGRVTIANADWSGAGPMLAAERLSVGVDIVKLIGGEIAIKRVEAIAPEILLEIARDGRANWQFETAGAAPAASSGGTSPGLPDFSLDKAVIENGKLTFIDHAGGGTTALTDVEATLRLPSLKGTVSADVAATMNGQRFDLSASISEFAAFLNSGAVPVQADIRIGGSKIGFEGRAGINPGVAAAGRLDADLADLGAVFALAGLAAPDLPPGLGRQMGLKGDVTYTDAGLALRDAVIRLDHNNLAGGADLALAGTRPRLTASLSGGALDFAALLGEPTGGEAATDSESIAAWPTDPIDVSGLHSIDANIALAADSLDLGLAKLGHSSVLVTMEDGRAVTEIREVRAYGGTIAGSVVVNARGGLSTRATLSARGVALQPLLQELAGYDRLLGSGDVAVNLLGAGNSVSALMNSLSGEGSLSIGKGEIRGLDLVGMLKNLDTSYVGEGSKTIFDGISGTFTVAGGVASNEDLRLTAPLLTATGKGKVGIGAQTIDYRAVPALLEGADGTGGFKVPLLITGTWADPRFRLDLEALAKQELGGEIEKVKTQAEAAVKAKLKEELGVEVENLDDVDEALKKELENRVEKGLLDLLGVKPAPSGN